MVHGTDEGFVKAAQRFHTMDDIPSLPPVSRMHFIECGANTGMEWGNGRCPPCSTATACCRARSSPACRWVVLEDCGVDWKKGKFVLAEGADGSSMTRTIPIELVQSDEVLVAYGQNGEMLRPENGYPLRLVVPGAGRELGEMAAPHRGGRPALGHQGRGDHYIDLMPDGQHRQYTRPRSASR